MGWLGSGPRLVGRIESGVRVSTSFQIVTLRMLLYNLRGGKPRIFSLGRGGGDLRGNVSRGLFPRIVSSAVPQYKQAAVSG